VSLPAWAAVGASSLLAGNTRLLLTTALVVSETSGCTPVIVPLVIATTVAKLVADASAQDVYAYQMEQAGYIFLEEGTDMTPGEMQRLVRAQVSRRGRSRAVLSEGAAVRFLWSARLRACLVWLGWVWDAVG